MITSDAAPEAKALLEEISGLSRPAIAKEALSWQRGRGAPAALTELDGLFRSGIPEGRWAALELAKQRRKEWDKRWGGLFLRWARTEDSSATISDALGQKFLGPLWENGFIEPRQMAALSLWPSLWPWRTGLTALSVSLSKNDSDWPLLEQFLKACLKPETRFHEERLAFTGLVLVLRAAAKAAPRRVADFLEASEPVLPAFARAALSGREEAEYD